MNTKGMRHSKKDINKWKNIRGGGEIVRGVVANVLDCDIIVSEFELLLHIHFWTNILGKV